VEVLDEGEGEGLDGKEMVSFDEAEVMALGEAGVGVLLLLCW